MPDSHLAFSIPRAAIRDRVLIPKYYDPDLDQAADLAGADFDLPLLGDLLAPGHEGSRLGDWVRREYYGTGQIPYVRTSDLAHWRIRPDFKKGVSADVFERYRDRQDIRPGDLLLVAHGTYLVGNVAMVTDQDSQLVLQDHIFRLRLARGAGVSSEYLLAALSTAFVRRQMRARQFSADIIDKIGERHLSIRVPVAKSSKLLAEVSSAVAKTIAGQDEARRSVNTVAASSSRAVREPTAARYAFSVRRKSIRGLVLVPKYYDPVLDADLAREQANHDAAWVPIGDLVASGFLQLGTGVEVGKMAYGTGDIPFIRTSDIMEWELSRNARHGVSRAIYEEFERKAGLVAGDVLLVRDGTYLVGSSALVMQSDLPALICGGMLRLRVGSSLMSDACGLLASLNHSLVRRQMRARQFTRDVIDTLGHRVLEVRIPGPTSRSWAQSAAIVESAVRAKERAKRGIHEAVVAIEPAAPDAMLGRPSWSMR